MARSMAVNCPNCGAAMRLDAAKECLACDFCGTIHFPEPNQDGVCLLGGRSPLPCPVCAVPLAEAAIAARPLLYCERCRGMLIGMGVFLELLDTLRAKHPPPERPHPLEPKDLKRSLRCPQCGQPMDAHAYAGPGAVVIDSCSGCELDWLDNSELRHIVAGAQVPPQDEEWCPLPPPPSAFFSDPDK